MTVNQMVQTIIDEASLKGVSLTTEAARTALGHVLLGWTIKTVADAIAYVVFETTE